MQEAIAEQTFKAVQFAKRNPELAHQTERDLRACIKQLERNAGRLKGDDRIAMEWYCQKGHPQMTCQCGPEAYRVKYPFQVPSSLFTNEPPATPAEMVEELSIDDLVPSQSGSMDTYPLEVSDDGSSWDTISDSGSEGGRSYYTREPLNEEWVRFKTRSPPWTSGKTNKAPEPPVWQIRTFKTTVYDFFNMNRDRLLDNIKEDIHTKLINSYYNATFRAYINCTCINGCAKFCEKHWSVISLKRVEVVDDEENEEELRRVMYEEYGAFAEFEPPVDQDNEEQVAAIAEPVDTKHWSFRAWIHNRFFKDHEINLDEALRRSVVHDNGSLYVHSELDSGKRWRVVKCKETGEVHCLLQTIPAVNNNIPGLSNTNAAFAEDESRVSKVMILSGFMKKRGLPFVDLELYYHLKSNNLNTGTAKSTHAKLSAKADVFLAQFRISQYDPQLLLEIKLWTVLAAMLPTKSELLALRLLGKAKVFGDINKVADFKRDGVVRQRRLWGLLPDRVHSLQHE